MIISVSPTNISYILFVYTIVSGMELRASFDIGEVLFPSPKGVEIGEAYSDIL
jgi:hypothetical protein